MHLKKTHGKIEIKALGIKLTQKSTEEQIKSALKAAPQLSVYIDGITDKPKAKKNG